MFGCHRGMHRAPPAQALIIRKLPGISRLPVDRTPARGDGEVVRMVGAGVHNPRLIRVQTRRIGRQRAKRLERGRRYRDLDHGNHAGANVLWWIVEGDRGAEILPSVVDAACDGSNPARQCVLTRQVGASDHRGLTLGNPRRLPYGYFEEHCCAARGARHNPR